MRASDTPVADCPVLHTLPTECGPVRRGRFRSSDRRSLMEGQLKMGSPRACNSIDRNQSLHILEDTQARHHTLRVLVARRSLLLATRSSINSALHPRQRQTRKRLDGQRDTRPHSLPFPFARAFRTFRHKITGHARLIIDGSLYAASPVWTQSLWPGELRCIRSESLRGDLHGRWAI